MSKKLTSKAKPAATTSSLELVRLEAFLKLMGKYGASELEYEDDHARIKLRFGAPSSGSYVPAPQPQTSAHSTASAPVASAPTKAAPPSNQKQIPSPFVGTFYRSASPTSELYVKEGQSVKKGQTLCIIEAMKLMNEIESDFNGKIIKVLVENGQPVEFGEPLFLIET